MVINVKNKKWILIIFLILGLAILFYFIDPFNFFGKNNPTYIAEKSSTSR